MSKEAAWPELPLEEWADTSATLQRWMQMVGKVRLALAPHLMHWWHVPLYVTASGLWTSTIPYGAEAFQVEFDFIRHQLAMAHSNGSQVRFPLRAEPVAEFHERFRHALRSLEVDVDIWTMPVEVEDPIPFERDFEHAAYDADYAHRFFRALVQANRVFEKFRSGFVGKVSPVHFFWGASDLAVTRFSGRPAPEHPGAPNVPTFVVREAYSHEVSSAGFWPGGSGYEDAAFYSYAYPEPEGFREAVVEPDEAFYSDALREFVLPYEAVRQSSEPETMLLRFLQTTYEAAAESGGWDRKALERPQRIESWTAPLHSPGTALELGQVP